MATESTPEEHPLRRYLDWILVPVGWVGALMAATLLLGMFLLWRFPGLARKNEVELRDLVGRAIDPHWGDPFYVLKGRDPWRAYKMDWNSSEDGQKVSGQVQASSKKVTSYRHEHQVYKDKKPVFVKVTTTPNLNPPVSELEKARKQLLLFFPAEGRGNPDRVVEWGRAVFTGWLRDEEDRVGRTADYYTPDRASEEECLWLAWRQLLTDLPSAEKDLPRLKELARQAFPSTQDYQAAMKWAATLHQRLDQTYQDWNGSAKFKLPAALPPKGEFSYHWLLYQYVGLTDESRAAIRQRWLSYFRPGKDEAVLKYGKQIEEKRRKDGEALPPSSDNVALLCVVERIRGTDANGEKCRQIIVKDVSTSAASTISGTVALGAYPNDDFFIVFAADDPFHSYEIPALRWVILLCQLIVIVGLRVFLFTVFAERILKLKDNWVYKQYRNRKPFYRDPVVLGTYLVVPFVAWLVSFLTLPTDLALMVPPFRRLLGVYLAVWLGGTLLTCLSRAVALLMIKAGLDPEKHWLDEAVSIPLAIFILIHFQNDFASIVFFLLIELIPELHRRLGPWRGVRPVRVQPTPRKQEGAPANVGNVWDRRGTRRPNS